MTYEDEDGTPVDPVEENRVIAIVVLWAVLLVAVVCGLVSCR